MTISFFQKNIMINKYLLQLDALGNKNTADLWSQRKA